MNSDYRTSSWLFESQLAPFVDAFMLHLLDCRYASNTINNYLAGLCHFAHWTTLCNIELKSIDEKLIQQFLNDHLPCCNCETPVFLARKDLSAALGHLLVLLRVNAVVANAVIGLTPVDEELRRFDEYMNHVRGLAPKTRKTNFCFIRRLLFGQFGDQDVLISAIQPDHIRQFVASQSELCKVPASISAPVSALRSYFRYRTILGDKVHHLVGVTSLCFITQALVSQKSLVSRWAMLCWVSPHVCIYVARAENSDQHLYGKAQPMKSEPGCGVTQCWVQTPRYCLTGMEIR